MKMVGMITNKDGMHGTWYILIYTKILKKSIWNAADVDWLYFEGDGTT